MMVYCKVCRKKFYVKPSHKKMGHGIYCSRKCSDAGRKTGEIVACTYCKKIFYARLKQIKGSKSGHCFCRRICYLSYQVWDKHPRWKDGKSAYLPFMRNNVKPICSRCGMGNKRVLLVHHVDKDRQNNVLSNLIWLCRNCHHLVHNYSEHV